MVRFEGFEAGAHNTLRHAFEQGVYLFLKEAYPKKLRNFRYFSLLYQRIVLLHMRNALLISTNLHDCLPK